MITILDKNQCCGCSACTQICPKGSIKMKSDEEGFEYPFIEKDKCINCDLCEKICPLKKMYKKDNQILKSYVTYAKETSMRLQSSSGGLFSALAEEILERNGVIFGAAFDEEFLVHHIGIESKEELIKLRGSKYLQSRIENTYYEAKKFIDAGRFVLYSGTACQIAGLKAYLQKEYENLYTIDVLCHGVPSPKVWKLYLEDKEKQHASSINSIDFRNKKHGWKTYSVELIFKNLKKYEEIFINDAFMQLFLKDICLRPSCHNCQFKNLNRPADITLGDCWGIENYMPNMDDDKGTSVMLIHSKRGEELFDIIKNQIIYCEANIDKVLPPTADSRKSVGIHPRRNEFFEKLNQGDNIEQLLKLTEPGITTKIKRKIKAIVKKII